ncbi:4-hydroxybenzoyl-CoA thioesterase [Azotobacter beijerinckii]|uniref:4-hydroxybenzoyl-CoA thioesterase n=1 Tax=Azotobacter beijerinckii TaxID=170623 RepID=A0A1H6SFP0_9GAMM|nr:acyl-CoA thioesterase [Azotobacter beijerinckii]SEI66798.1 4-hydroxybenzoyl-CoA thioesterase [Azotobacter beijerinckii]
MRNVYEVRIAWGDCDPAGIVFYPNYFSWFNAATDALFASVGLPLEQAMARHGIVGWPMVDTRASFRLPSRFGEVLRIESHLQAFQRSSFEVRHRACKADGTLAVEARDIRVWTSSERGTLSGLRIPDEVRELFVLGS